MSKLISTNIIIKQQIKKVRIKQRTILFKYRRKYQEWIL